MSCEYEWRVYVEMRSVNNHTYRMSWRACIINTDFESLANSLAARRVWHSEIVS